MKNCWMQKSAVHSEKTTSAQHYLFQNGTFTLTYIAVHFMCLTEKPNEHCT